MDNYSDVSVLRVITGQCPSLSSSPMKINNALNWAGDRLVIYYTNVVVLIPAALVRPQKKILERTQTLWRLVVLARPLVNNPVHLQRSVRRTLHSHHSPVNRKTVVLSLQLQERPRLLCVCPPPLPQERPQKSTHFSISTFVRHHHICKVAPVHVPSSATTTSAKSTAGIASNRFLREKKEVVVEIRNSLRPLRPVSVTQPRGGLGFQKSQSDRARHTSAPRHKRENDGRCSPPIRIRSSTEFISGASNESATTTSAKSTAGIKKRLWWDYGWAASYGKRKRLWWDCTRGGQHQQELPPRQPLLATTTVNRRKRCWLLWHETKYTPDIFHPLEPDVFSLPDQPNSIDVFVAPQFLTRTWEHDHHYMF